MFILCHTTLNIDIVLFSLWGEGIGHRYYRENCWTNSRFSRHMRHQDGPILTLIIYPMHDDIIGVELQAENFRQSENVHDDVIKWKQFPRYWPCVWGIRRSPVSSPNKGQWRGVLMFSLIWASTNGWVNNWDAGDSRRHRTHHDVPVMLTICYNIHCTHLQNRSPLNWKV